MQTVSTIGLDIAKSVFQVHGVETLTVWWLPDHLVSQRGSPTMSDDNARTEKAAASENDWVRARILKQEPPVEGSLLKIAERARDMAARSLGNRHPAYAVSLQNLGIYYDAIENDDLKAIEFFEQARAVLNENELPLADGFYWLGIFHLNVKHDPLRAQSPLTEALEIQRRARGGNDLQLADKLIALAWAKAAASGTDAAIELMGEALKIQRAQLPPTDPAIQETEKRLTIFQAMVSAEFGE
jgi:tetratricopeptide (TPR) repeat protein